MLILSAVLPEPCVRVTHRGMRAAQDQLARVPLTKEVDDSLEPDAPQGRTPPLMLALAVTLLMVSVFATLEASEQFLKDSDGEETADGSTLVSTLPPGIPPTHTRSPPSHALPPPPLAAISEDHTAALIEKSWTALPPPPQTHAPSPVVPVSTHPPSPVIRAPSVSSPPCPPLVPPPLPLSPPVPPLPGVPSPSPPPPLPLPPRPLQYIVGSVGSSECPMGTAALESKLECRESAAALAGSRFAGASCYTDHYPSCFWQSSGDVQWNTCPGSAAGRSGHAAVCK